MKLKAVLVCLFAFCISILSSNAQPTTWAQPEAHWYYTEGDLSYSTGYFEIWEDGDTTFANGIVCDILRSYREGIIFPFPGGPYNMPGPTWYTYQSNDTVYVYYNNQFNILFIDNQVPGTFFISGPDIYGACDGDTIEIDSLYSVTLNGFTMNKIVPVVPNWGNGQWPPGGASIAYHYPIYTRFGSTAFFIPAPNCVTDVAFGPLRCYSDSLGFTFTTNVTPTCDYVTGLYDEITGNSSWQVFPNPATDKLFISQTIQDYQLQGSEMEIVNIKGELILKFNYYSGMPIDVSTFPKGNYLLKTNVNNTVISFFKL